MEPQTHSIKNIVVGAVVILLVGLAIYFFFFKTTSQQVVFDQFGNPIEAQVVGQDLIDLLAKLQSVELDESLFQDKAFVSLTDYSVTLPDQLQGRNDPFQPIPGRAPVSLPVKGR
jgi:hypothetical protein